MSSSNSADFYATLPKRENFKDVADLSVYTPVPDDWYVLVSDVVGSTEAIRAGRYREVNTIGASTIVALLNVARAASPPVEVPFLFGGDGATVVVPKALLESSKKVMLSAQRVSVNSFGLELRIGAISVAEIRQAGFELKIAKFRVSPYYDQAMFSGGGTAFADRVLKEGGLLGNHVITDLGEQVDADFAGLECRWRDVPSDYGETITLIISAISESETEKARVYGEVIEFIQTTFDGTQQPIAANRMELTTSPRAIRYMAPYATEGGWLSRMLFQLRTVLENRYFSWARFRGKTVRGVTTDELISTTIAATDHRKFDDALRMVLSSTPERRKSLTEYLERRSESGDLWFGMHLSDRALLTCVVFEQAGTQVHFVDGADGGYAMAAAQLKGKMA